MNITNNKKTTPPSPLSQTVRAPKSRRDRLSRLSNYWRGVSVVQTRTHYKVRLAMDRANVETRGTIPCSNELGSRVHAAGNALAPGSARET